MKKIKAIFLCLGLSAMFAFAGCAKKTVDASVVSTIENNRVGLINLIVNDTVDKNALLEISDEDYEAKQEVFEKAELKFASKDVFTAAVNSCIIAEEEAGTATQVNRDIAVSGNEEDGYKAVVSFACSKDRIVNMNIAYDADLNITDITFSPVYTMGESMTKAALNTLLGMGSVFSVLVLIMFIIYLFGIIPKIQKSIETKKKEKEKADTEKSVDKTIANIVEKEEGELVDDYELVAVITAAIKAYEGNASADGFVVRSIKKSQSKKWQNAQY